MATDAEIRHSFREMAKIYHPDINKSDDATDTFRMLYVAYDTLSDPFKRKMYDEILQGDLLPREELANMAYQEKMRRRADIRARAYAAMQYEEFEDTAFTRATFHAKQVVAFIIFFTMLCGGMICFITGAHYVFIQTFNGAQVAGYGFWAAGAVLSYISGKALLEIYTIWRS